MAAERINDEQGQPESIPEELHPGKPAPEFNPAHSLSWGLPPADLDDFYEGDDPNVTYWGLFDD